MKRYQIKVIYFIAILAILVSLSMGHTILLVAAEVGNQRVFDEANLLSQEEVGYLTDRIASLQELMNADIAIITTYHTQGLSAFDFADQFYDEHHLGFGSDKSGVLFLIDLDNRELELMTEGKMIDYLTDERVDQILDLTVAAVREGDYFQAVSTFLARVEQFYHEGIVDGQYRFSDQRAPITWQELATMLVISAGIGGIFYGVVNFKYRRAAPAQPFVARQSGRIHLTHQQDVFINKRLSKIRLPKDPPPSSFGGGSSGGLKRGQSTTRTASSGRTRGGGGRGF